MAEHTPGPWKWAQETPTSGGTVKAVDAVNGYICTTSGNVKGNTPLIAAAPDMLEALECIEAGSGYAQLTDGKLNKIRAAIAKARGRV